MPLLYETLDEKATSVPITKSGANKYIRVYSLQVTGLQAGDVVDLTGTVSATNPYTYNVMFGVWLTRTRFPDVWVNGAVNVARPHVLNITPATHHYAFPVVRFDQIKDGEDGDWWYHFICYSASSGAVSGHKMQIDPYGCLQAVVLHP